MLSSPDLGDGTQLLNRGPIIGNILGTGHMPMIYDCLDDIYGYDML